jgi:uncharacterized membrane protein (DUF373 family)
MTKILPSNWTDMRRDWGLLTAYQRFESMVAFTITMVIGLVILVALCRLIVNVADTLVLRTLNPLEHTVFQVVFGDIMTLLIALEFNHTMQYVIARERGVVQAKIVVLIALLALARKVIVIDLHTTAPATVAALAALALSLGMTYWLIRDGDDAGEGAPHHPGPLTRPPTPQEA